MCDLGFLMFDLGFEVGFWKVFTRILGLEKGWLYLSFLRFLGVVWWEILRVFGGFSRLKRMGFSRVFG